MFPVFWYVVRVQGSGFRANIGSQTRTWIYSDNTAAWSHVRL